MNVCDEKLRNALLEILEKEDAQLEEELMHCEPHVFSQEFEQKMNQLLDNHGRKKAPYGYRKKPPLFWKPLAAIVVVCIIVSGTMFAQSSSLQASALRIDILEWLDKFFTVEDGEAGKSEENILFEEAQIGYLPEGFVKVNENITFSQIQLEYKNEKEEYIVLHIYRGKILFTADNETASREVYVNEVGYEYTIIDREDSTQTTVLWKDEQEINYCIESSLDEDELMKIMNNISYKGENKIEKHK